jgi:hypothetical protein
LATNGSLMETLTSNLSIWLPFGMLPWKHGIHFKCFEMCISSNELHMGFSFGSLLVTASSVDLMDYKTFVEVSIR